MRGARGDGGIKIGIQKRMSGIETEEQKERQKIKEKERDEKKEVQHIGEICVAVWQWKQ